MGRARTNGAGKTTLLQIAAATMHPTSVPPMCSANASDGSICSSCGEDRHVQFALAQPDPGQRAVVDVVVTPAMPSSAAGGRRTGDSTCAGRGAAGAVRGRGPGRAPVGTLSEGERKRVQIARALMTDPELLLSTSRPPEWTRWREDLIRRLTDFAMDPMPRRRSWSPTTSRSYRPGSRTCCSCATAQPWPRAAGAVLTPDNLSATFACPCTSSAATAAGTPGRSELRSGVN